MVFQSFHFETENDELAAKIFENQGNCPSGEEDCLVSWRIIIMIIMIIIMIITIMIIIIIMMMILMSDYNVNYNYNNDNDENNNNTRRNKCPSLLRV